jgi:hypothetical protein
MRSAVSQSGPKGRVHEAFSLSLQLVEYEQERTHIVDYGRIAHTSKHQTNTKPSELWYLLWGNIRPIDRKRYSWGSLRLLVLLVDMQGQGS